MSPPAGPSKRQAIAEARCVLEQITAIGEEFYTTDVRTALHARLSAIGGYQAIAFDGLVDWAIERINKDSTHEDGSEQPCLPGFDLEGVYKLGGNLRIGKRHAQRHHAETALAIDDANLASVTIANQRKHDELNLLAKYWLPGMTKAEAVAAYQAANPLDQAS